MPRIILALLIWAAAPAAQAATPQIHAHRGGPVIDGKSKYGENTMPAFENAVALHAALELDTRITKDRRVIVMHDATLDRTTSCTGAVKEKTLAEIRPCRVDMIGSPESKVAPPARPASKPEPIPTLAEVLALAKRTRSTVDVELNDFEPGFGNAVVVADAILASKIPQKQVIVQSFLPGNLDAARPKLPGAEFAIITLAGFNDNALSTDYDWSFPNWPLRDGFVSDAHRKGLRVAPYTLNRAKDIAAAAKLGVDGVITDDPMLALRTLDRRPPTVSVRAATSRISTARRGRLPVTVRLSEAGKVIITARLHGRKIGSMTFEFTRGDALTGPLKLSSAGRQALADANRATIALTAAAKDLAGNAKTARSDAALR